MLEEQNIIGHLFDVEREAAELLSDAQDEYNKRMAAAREQADASYKEAFEKIIAKEEARYNAAVTQLEKEKTVAFDAYCADLREWKQDRKALGSLLDTYLFTAAGNKTT